MTGVIAVLDAESFLLGMAAGGGGSGNLNYVETISGTLANPWGDIDPSELDQSVLSGDASVQLNIDATALGFGVIPTQMSPFDNESIIFDKIFVASSSAELWEALDIFYNLQGTIQAALLLQNGAVTDMTQYAAMLPTVLTIIHHPLP